MRDIAIRNTHPSVVTINAETEAWDINGDIVTLDESLIDAEILRLQAEYDAQEYARLRKAEYPPIEDQLDMQYLDLVNGTTVWLDTVQAVKDQFPKE